MSSGWFDCTEPSLSTSLQGKQGMEGAYALVRGGSSTSNLLEPHHYKDSKVCREFCHMSSGWFDHTEPSLSTSLQGKQGMEGAYALVRGGSSTSNLLEPHHYKDSKVCRVNSLLHITPLPSRTLDDENVCSNMKFLTILNNSLQGRCIGREFELIFHFI